VDQSDSQALAKYEIVGLHNRYDRITDKPNGNHLLTNLQTRMSDFEGV